MQGNEKLGFGCMGCIVVPIIMVLLLFAGVGGFGAPAQASPGQVCAGTDGDGTPTVEGLEQPQIGYAAAVVVKGEEMGLGENAWVIAIATTLVESGLKMYANTNVPESFDRYHDEDWYNPPTGAVGSDHLSVGLFQQQTFWGPLDVLMDPDGSAGLFYDKLKDLDWQGADTDVKKGILAQTVQVSAFPDRYAEQMGRAREIVGAVKGILCTPGTGGANPNGEAIIAAAMEWLGTDYVWGGGDAYGPTTGTCGGGDCLVGFDCSGLTLYAYAQVGISTPHYTGAIWDQFQPANTDINQIAPGDLILFSSNESASGIHHVGIYLGDGAMIHAPQTGDVVKIDENIWDNSYWADEFIGSVRPGATENLNV